MEERMLEPARVSRAAGPSRAGSRGRAAETEAPGEPQAEGLSRPWGRTGARRHADPSEEPPAALAKQATGRDPERTPARRK